MMEEIWKDVKGFEGLYQVSNLGRVRSLDRIIHRAASRRSKDYECIIKGRIIKQCNMTSGYLFVGLWKNGSHYYRGVHKLVADAFIPNPNNLPQVNHKDENKHNNIVENLEHCSASYNVMYGPSAIRRQAGNVRNRKAVYQLSTDGIIIQKFNSIREAHIVTGINKNSISLVCRGKGRQGKHYITAGGYKWRFAG